METATAFLKPIFFQDRLYKKAVIIIDSNLDRRFFNKLLYLLNPRLQLVLAARIVSISKAIQLSRGYSV